MHHQQTGANGSGVGQMSVAPTSTVVTSGMSGGVTLSGNSSLVAVAAPGTSAGFGGIHPFFSSAAADGAGLLDQMVPESFHTSGGSTSAMNGLSDKEWKQKTDFNFCDESWVNCWHAFHKTDKNM